MDNFAIYENHLIEKNQFGENDEIQFWVYDSKEYDANVVKTFDTIGQAIKWIEIGIH